MKGYFPPLLQSISPGHLVLICLSDQRSFNQRNTDPQLHFSDNQTFHGFLPEKIPPKLTLSLWSHTRMEPQLHNSQWSSRSSFWRVYNHCQSFILQLNICIWTPQKGLWHLQGLQWLQESLDLLIRTEVQTHFSHNYCTNLPKEWHFQRCCFGWASCRGRVSQEHQRHPRYHVLASQDVHFGFSNPERL